MKKTYFAPELENVKLMTSPMFQSASPTKIHTEDNEGVGGDAVLSKGFGGGLWDDGDAEEN